jgi:IMP cyclohydrolase
MTLRETAERNLTALRANPYPGRGIVIGQTPDGRALVQVYWIMGRSENSRNRIFVADGDRVRTAPFDASKVEDPSLIIYTCARVAGRAHVVTNGDQTDTIADALQSGVSFEQAVYTRSFEPDAPNYTPRISGVANLGDPRHAYQLAILKTLDGDPSRTVRQVFSYDRAVPGIGHFVSTYEGDGKPLPSFVGEPRPMPVGGEIGEVCAAYWAALNEANRVSLLVKTVDVRTGVSDVRIVNRHGRAATA